MFLSVIALKIGLASNSQSALAAHLQFTSPEAVFRLSRHPHTRHPFCHCDAFYSFIFLSQKYCVPYGGASLHKQLLLLSL